VKKKTKPLKKIVDAGGIFLKWN